MLEARAAFAPDIIALDNFAAHAGFLAQVEVGFSTWGMPNFDDAQLDAMPKLRAIFYAAGSVQGFARRYLERGIEVFSGWTANGVPVAEWTLAQILLAGKGAARNERQMRAARSRNGAHRGRGNFGATTSILGAGVIGRRVIELLQPFELHICVFDPFLSDEAALALGVEKVDLETAFARGDVVSNHIANLPATQEMLTGAHFDSMPENATFINTGRGQTVRESEMIAVLERRSDLTAQLDVTHPEPPLPDSPLWSLENVFLTAHLAGSLGDEVVRMADYMISEFDAWQNGKPTRFSVTLAMLETMA